ncbi:MAG: hypothetical protein ACI9VR_003436 [Cognaticolwellia sp.]
MSAQELKTEVLAYITRAAADPAWGLAQREELGMRIHAFQRAEIPDLDAFCAGAEPEHLVDVPSVPVGLFKEGLNFCIPATGKASSRRVFRTSGTTQGRRGEHHMPDTQVYERAARLWWQACVPGCPERVVSLVPDPAQAPDSSLGHMVHDFGAVTLSYFDMEHGVDHDGAWQALLAVQQPVFVAATAFSMASLLEQGPSLSLPKGSVCMVTGGFKGRRVSLSSKDLLEQIPERLGTPVVEEYGMSELSSQLWGGPDFGGAGRFHAPPWMRVYTVDPATGAPCTGTGLLRFVDLANWASCLSIETQDLGEVDGQWVTLKGRLQASPHRGCSLSAEEAGQWRP